MSDQAGVAASTLLLSQLHNLNVTFHEHDLSHSLIELTFYYCPPVGTQPNSELLTNPSLSCAQSNCFRALTVLMVFR